MGLDGGMRLWLGIGVLGWTLLAWGGRVVLLSTGDDWSDLVRIGGSVVVGVVTALVIWFARSGRVIRPVVYLFAAWTVVIWGRSMWVNWSGGGTLPFKMVHTVLAVGFLALVYLTLSFARRHPVTGPDQGGGQEQRDGETGRLAEG